MNGRDNKNGRGSKVRQNRYERGGNKGGYRAKKGGPAAVFLKILIVLLSLILVIECVHFFSEISSEDVRYHPEEKDYVRAVNYENYYRVLHNTIDDNVISRKYTERENEIRALGYYYEAASLYKAYQTVEDSVSSEIQKERMERYRREAGSYESETERIDELMGVS